MKRGLTQVKLASLAGVTQGAVMCWEKGTAFPTASRLAKVSHALGVDTDVLIAEAERRANQKEKGA